MPLPAKRSGGVDVTCKIEGVIVSRIGCLRMLTLRKDWRTVLGGAVAVDLVTQIHRRKQRERAASHLVAASLDLLVATWPRRERPYLTIETLSNLTWCISGLHYIYVPEDDDTALGTCIELARSSELTVILPRCHEGLKRRLLMAALGQRAPNTWSFDAFISWRTTSATVDQNWPPGRALLELLGAYNRRVSDAGNDDSMLVEVSQ